MYYYKQCTEGILYDMSIYNIYLRVYYWDLRLIGELESRGAGDRAEQG